MKTKKLFFLFLWVFTILLQIGAVSTNGPKNFYVYPQCTWYAAQQMPEVLVFRGNAKDWDNLATKAGFTVIDYPVVGSIVVFEPGVQGIPANSPKNICGGKGCGHVGLTEWVDENKYYFKYSSTNSSKNPELVTIHTAHKGEGVHFILPKTEGLTTQVPPSQPEKDELEVVTKHPLQIASGILTPTQNLIVISDIDGLNPKELLNGLDVIQEMKWSPNGKTLAVIANPRNTNDTLLNTVWFVDADTKKVVKTYLGTNITYLFDENKSFGWSSNSKKIAIICADATQNIDRARGWNICVIDAKSGQYIKVGPSAAYDFVTWGKNKIVFASYDCKFDKDCAHGLYSMNDNGSEISKIQTFDESEPHNIDDILTSPNGERIALILRSDYYSDLYVINVNGSGFHRLTATGDVQGMTWSTDSKKIAFIRFHPMNEKSGLHIINSDGSSLERVVDTDYREFELYFPRWSPDGNLIKFTAFLKDSFNPEIRIFSLGSRELRKFTVSTYPENLIYRTEWRP